MATFVNLKNIRDQIKLILDTANTTTSSPIDLSSGMVKRVQKVLTLHPEQIPVQASYFPFVTCFVTKKTIESDDIAKNQLGAKRKATISIDVLGAVYAPNMITNLEDPSDNNINLLMENVELCLRSNDTLNNSVLYHAPQDITYYSTRLNEQTHLRVGVLTLDCTVFY